MVVNLRYKTAFGSFARRIIVWFLIVFGTAGWFVLVGEAVVVALILAKFAIMSDGAQ